MPLEGYYRVGRTFPVTSESGVVIRGVSTVPARSEAAGVVPGLCLSDSVTQIDAGGVELSVRALSPGQKLALFVDAPLQDLSEAMEGFEIIAVGTTSSLFNRQSIAAWESVDVVVMQTLPPMLETIVAMGIDVIVLSDRPPRTTFSVESRGRLHHIRSEVTGPRGIITGVPMGELFSWWRGGQSQWVRTASTWIAVILPLGLGACLLLRGRRLVTGAALAGSVLAVGGIVMWITQMDPLNYASGRVRVHMSDRTQDDVYAVVRARRDGQIRLPLHFRPLISSIEDALRSGLAIEVDAGTRASWLVPLARGQRMVFVNREVRGRTEVPALSGGEKSAMRAVARLLYTDTGLRTVGEAELSPVDGWEQWGTVILQR
jgi:hypothetical protein